MEKGKSIVTKGRSAIQSLAERLQIEPESLKLTLKATAFAGCKTDAEFISAVIVANTYGLNPLLKEMYAFPGRGGVIPIVSVDGWISLVNRQQNFDGVELIENETDDGSGPGGLKSVTAKFYIKGKSHPVIVTEYMDECFDSTKEPWKRWPRRMLRHKAYIQGGRIAFGFSGIYDEDEAHRIIEAQVVDTVAGKPATAAPKAKEIEAKPNTPPEEKKEDATEPDIEFGAKETK